MIAGTDMEGADVVTILRKAYGEHFSYQTIKQHFADQSLLILFPLLNSGTNQGLFNNAAQSWNHAFYWDCMKPNGGGVATGKVAALIDKQFGSYDKFRAEFVAAGNNLITSENSPRNSLNKRVVATKLILSKTHILLSPSPWKISHSELQKNMVSFWFNHLPLTHTRRTHRLRLRMGLARLHSFWPQSNKEHRS